MDEVECLEQLEEDLLDVQCLQPLRVFLQLLQDGFLYVLEHEVKFAILPKHFQQGNDVLVTQLLQDADLTQSGLANLLVLWGGGGTGETIVQVESAKQNDERR